MSHLLDANVFMEAGRTYYRPRVAPGFWEWLATSAATGVIASTEGVRDEIGRGSTLAHLTDNLPPQTWRRPTEATLEAAARLAAWAVDPGHLFTVAARDEFLDSADLMLVAEAMGTGDVVVTREVSAPGSRNSIKIPDVCVAFSVPCVQPFDAFERLGLHLVL